jgi:hypothetical protein
MAEVKVTITGAQQARFKWDKNYRTLQSGAAGKWSAELKASTGRHEYRVWVTGNPNDPWSCKVKTGTAEDEVEGEMDGKRRDESGKRYFDVP